MKEHEKDQELRSLRANETEDIDHQKVRITLWVTAAVGFLLAGILIALLLRNGGAIQKKYEKVTILPSASVSKAGKDQVTELVLNGVMLSGPDKGAAVFSYRGETILAGLGEPVGSTGWTLEAVTMTSATLSADGDTIVLNLASKASGEQEEGKFETKR